jgi:hypothetical protein
MEIIHNLTERIAEAKMNGWLGEVEGLRVSLRAAQTKLMTLNGQRKTLGGTITDLGLPILGDNSRPQH